LRVPNDAALEYYQERFNEFAVKNEGIKELFGKKVLPFEESDGQRYQLFSDEKNEGVAPGTPWKHGPVPDDKAIYGLGPSEITVSYYEDLKQVLTSIYDMKPVIEEDDVTVFDVGAGGNGGQVILRKDESTQGQQGYGE